MDEMQAIEDALKVLDEAELADVYVSIVSNMDTAFIIKLKTLCLWYDGRKYIRV